jgi:hypothetical protein
MADGWTAVAGTDSTSFSGMVSGVGVNNPNANNTYNAAACSAGPCGMRDVSGNGHAEFNVRFAASTGSVGSEITGMTSAIGLGSKGRSQVQIRDANNGLMYNETRPIGDGGPGDSFLNLAILTATFDPNVAQYASLDLKISVSGKIVTGSIGWGSVHGFC